MASVGDPLVQDVAQLRGVKRAGGQPGRQLVVPDEVVPAHDLAVLLGERDELVGGGEVEDALGCGSTASHFMTFSGVTLENWLATMDRYVLSLARASVLTATPNLIPSLAASWRSVLLCGGVVVRGGRRANAAPGTRARQLAVSDGCDQGATLVRTACSFAWGDLTRGHGRSRYPRSAR